jgi:hypothetical protein
MGKLEINPWFIFVFDFTTLTALICWHPLPRRGYPKSACEDRTPNWVVNLTTINRSSNVRVFRVNCHRKL